LAAFGHLLADFGQVGEGVAFRLEAPRQFATIEDSATVKVMRTKPPEASK
jgi:hypothetical protein